ncbi:MAG: SprT family zinc-dependent metalloprotease [Candidatus Choladocola sp.]|nr:SprT family zinc-dependent metalloprotease [Candidatus Choladocola sp.]
MNKTEEKEISADIGGHPIPCTVIRSSRKSLGLEIRADGSIVVRAPYRVSEKQINSFLCRKSSWITEHRSRVLTRTQEKQQHPVISEAEKKRMRELAEYVFSVKTARFAQIAGVAYGKITVRDQKTRWGSCSSRGNLNFNFRLMMAPEEIQDYVVVHELCHRKFMNHSPQFWAEVEKILPDYRERRIWLRENGWRLMD